MIAATTGISVMTKDERKERAERQRAIRDSLWPDAAANVWHRGGPTKGFTTIPRLIPLITTLFRELSKTGDPSSVYWDLWARDFDDAFIEIDDEAECAYSSGYTGARAVRTWRERMDLLEDLGFIRIKASGNRKYANVLILNPLLVAARIHKAGRPRIPEEWWTAFVTRAAKIKAVIPEV